jgi:nicotinate-nucleotide--dimethylbenzimidazole phosphoribosyltransferase
VTPDEHAGPPAAHPGPSAADAGPAAAYPASSPRASDPGRPAEGRWLAPDQHAFPPSQREAVYRVLRERRDVRRNFRPDPVPAEVLERVLAAAHLAPSVGFSQPWDFIVITDQDRRARIRELAERSRLEFAASLPGARARAFDRLKTEAILEAPVSIVVTCDPTRGGRHTLGRHAQPQTAAYSSVLAVASFWLAARAEGLGVGWVSFFDERELAAELQLPSHVQVSAYLCVGYVASFPPEPELALSRWASRRPLGWAVHAEEYGRRGLPGQPAVSVLDEVLAEIRPLDIAAQDAARQRQAVLTKPAGSLGVLEDVSVQLCGLAGSCPPPMPEPAVVAIFAGDHGVHAQGVTPWPQEVTGQMVANFLAGGAVVNAFAAQAGAEVVVVDVGVAADLDQVPGLLPRKIGSGTADFTVGPAMTRDEALAAVEAGIEVARDLVAAGNRCLLTGDMGIANTTASAALICAFTGVDAAAATGRGTGVDDETLARKVAVVSRALALHSPDREDPLGTLAALGGFEHAALAGFMLAAAGLRVPVVLDGVIAGSAALAACALAPDVVGCLVAGHRSAEPGHTISLAHLGLRPLVDLDLRLGEGTGALLALPIVQSAARVIRDVATFDAAGVTEK